MSGGKKWADMTAEERAEQRKTEQDAALVRITEGGFPTGLKIETVAKSLNGKILRPVRGTDSGGVSYSLPAMEISINGQKARLNKFSVSLIGEGSMALPEGFDENLV